MHGVDAMKSRKMVALVVGLAVQVGCGDVLDDGGLGSDGGLGALGNSPSTVAIDGDQVGGGRVTPGNGARVDHFVALGGFTRVSADSALDVEVKQGSGVIVIVSIDSNLLAQVTTELRGDTLVLGTKGSFETKLPGPHIKVTLPQLVEANNGGSGDLAVANVETAELALGSSGSGDLSFEGSASRLVVESSGSGDSTIIGTSRDLTIQSSGSGDVDAEELGATTATVSNSGSGDVSITASGTASTRLSGSGDIEIHGGAQVQQGLQTGSGRVKQD